MLIKETNLMVKKSLGKRKLTTGLRAFVRGGGLEFSIDEVDMAFGHEDFIYYYVLRTGR